VVTHRLDVTESPAAYHEPNSLHDLQCFCLSQFADKTLLIVQADEVNMKSLSAVLLLPVLSLLSAGACSAQTTAMLVDAPLPPVTTAASQPEEAFSSSAMGVYPVRVPQPVEKKPGLKVLDWSMLGATAALRVLDYTTTEKALTEPQYYHEAMLPQGLVKNKPAFAAFEAGTVGVNYMAYRILVRHNMRSLARASQFVYVGVMTFQVAHNYQTLGTKPALP
jgi:hypothetical protein